MKDHWKCFEANMQYNLAPLLCNISQKNLFIKTNNCHERLFFDICCRLLKPTFFLEIGAYEGDNSWRVSQRLPEANCVAFEADNEVFSHYAAVNKANNRKSNNYKYENVAISNRDDSIIFYKEFSDSKTLKPLPTNSVLTKKGKEYIQVKMQAISLDTYLGPLHETDSVVLRIDVEGNCYSVLEGARQTLKQCSAIYAEVEDHEVWESQKTVFEVHSFLEEYGLIPVSRDVQTPSQYNVIWLHSELVHKRAFRARLSLFYKELMQIVNESQTLTPKPSENPIK